MTDPKEKLAEELLEHMKAKDPDTTLTDHMEAFAKQKNMRQGQVSGLYYSKVRNNYEKWQQAQNFRSKQTDTPAKEEKKLQSEQQARPKTEPSPQDEMKQISTKPPMFMTEEGIKFMDEHKHTMAELSFYKRQTDLLKKRLNEARQMPQVDRHTMKMRIAFIELKVKTVKDPFQKLIMEPWLAELKEAEARMEQETMDEKKAEEFYKSIQP